MAVQRPRGGSLKEESDSESDGGVAAVRDQRLLDLQMEALGSARRGAITEQGHKEDLRQETRSVDSLQALRKANQAGTQEIQDDQNLKSLVLTSRKEAWVKLSKDGTAELTLGNMNDGQTHRAKLMADPSLKNYVEGSDSLDRPSERGYGRNRRGRGGGAVGSRSGHHGPRRIPTGIDPPLNGLNGRHAASAGTQSNRTAQAQAPRIEPVALRRLQREVAGQRASTPSIASAEQFMALHARSTQAARTERTAPTVTGPRGTLVSPEAFMAAARTQLRISSTGSPSGSVSDTTKAAQKESEESVSVPLTEVGPSQSTPLDAKGSDLIELATKEPLPRPARYFVPHSEGPNLLDLPNDSISDAPLEADKPKTDEDRSESAAGQSKSSVPNADDDKLAQAIRLMSDMKEKMIPPALLKQLLAIQAKGAAQPASASEQPPNPVPRVVIRPSQRLATVGTNLKALTPPPSPTSIKFAVAAPVKKLSQETPRSQAAPEPEVSTPVHQATPKHEASTPVQKTVETKPVIEPAAPAQPILDSTSPTQLSKHTALKPTLILEGRPIIFGERVVRDRYHFRQESLASSTGATVDSISSVSASFDRLTLADRTEAGEQSVDSLSSAEAKTIEFGQEDSQASTESVNEGVIQSHFDGQIPELDDDAAALQYAPEPVRTPEDLAAAVGAMATEVAEEDPKTPTEPLKKGIVQPAFDLLQTTELNDGAVGPQNAPVPSKTPPTPIAPTAPIEAMAAEATQEYSEASTEPVNEGIVQPRFIVRQTPTLIDSAVAREYARPPLQTPVYAIINPFATPAAEGRSRATSRTPSAEQQPSSRREPSPFSERFPTVPYNWSEAPRRAANTNVPRKQLPAFLQGLQPNKDPTASVRAQYGGIAPNARVDIENRDPRSDKATTTSPNGSTVTPSSPSSVLTPKRGT
ncbi:MAG: hypothetical protein Q9191_002306 [Dirinaria sp. TL-2023a]